MADLLTEDVWKLILQHVPQADRLQRCALVCLKLSKAAAAATDAIRASRWRGQQQLQQRAEALDSYLQHYGSYVTSLVLERTNQPLTQLPCVQLLRLDITGPSRLQLGPSNGPGVLSSATGLTALHLNACIVTPHGGLSRLSVLVDLQELLLHRVQQAPRGLVTLPGAVLPSLEHLTRLDLSESGGIEDVQHVSSLTSLSVLTIDGVGGSQPVRLAPGIAPGFVLPASLQGLRLGSGIELDPAVLIAATKLTSLELVELGVVGPRGGGVSSGAALLALIAELPQLVELQLSKLADVEWPAPCASYKGLTASSKLQTLTVAFSGLPAGVWAARAFPPARCCPAMRVFDAIEDNDYSWGAAAVSNLVRCCPGLQDLYLQLSGGAPVAALKPLTALTALRVFVVCTHNQADVGVSVSHIAALTSLQQLQLRVSRGGQGDAGAATLSGAALFPLTSLRQLTQCNVGLGTRLTWAISNEADPGQPPDVWLQVLERCLQASNCQPAVTAVATHLAQQNAQQEQRIAELELQNAQQEQRTAELEQQMQQLMQHLQL